MRVTGHQADHSVNRAHGSCSLAKLKQETDKVAWAIGLLPAQPCSSRANAALSCANAVSNGAQPRALQVRSWLSTALALTTA